LQLLLKIICGFKVLLKMCLNKFGFRLALRIFWLTVSVGAVAYCVARGWYAVAGGCAVALVVAIVKLYAFQRRTVRDMQRLIEAIKFSEFNITFKYFSSKGLSPDLVPEMENAVKQFNQRQKKSSSELIFYDMLLNRIDFGVIVVGAQGKTVWLNKWVTDLFVSPHPKCLADFSRISPELPEIFENLHPNDTKILNINDVRIAATSVFFFSEDKQLKVITLKNVRAIVEESESDAWRKLIRVLTHEMMNSLTPIISLSETFAEENSGNLQEGTDMLRRAMQTIHRRSKGLVQFVGNYRRLAQIPQPVVAEFTALEWLEDIKYLLAAEGYCFEFKVKPETLKIKADRNLLEQALINIIRNACESSSEQVEVKVEIDIDIYNRLRIMVIDNGDGILPEVMERIFVPFFTTKSTGSGIGLSISQQIVKMHGGTLSACTKQGQGSCFTITL
jgi:nitrogen fixation/metabolism regulation signal transduction histidine kinase